MTAPPPYQQRPAHNKPRLVDNHTPIDTPMHRAPIGHRYNDTDTDTDTEIETDTDTDTETETDTETDTETRAELRPPSNRTPRIFTPEGVGAAPTAPPGIRFVVDFAVVLPVRHMIGSDGHVTRNRLKAVYVVCDLDGQAIGRWTDQGIFL